MSKTGVAWFVSCIYFFVAGLPVSTTAQNELLDTERDSLIRLYQHTELNDSSKAYLANTIAAGILRQMPDSALYYIQESRAFAERQNNERLLAELINNTGKVYYQKDQPDSMAVYFYEALQRYEQLGDSIGVAQALNNCGLTYVQLRRYERAEAFFKQSMELSERLSYQRGIVVAVTNLADLKTQQEDWSEAINLYTRAESILEEMQYEMGLAYVYGPLGKIYYALGEPDSAISYLKRSIAIDERYENNSHLAEYYYQLGKCLLELERYDEAEAQAAKLIMLNRTRLQSLQIAVWYEELMFTISKRQGRYEAALAHAEHQLILQDSLAQSLLNGQILELQEQYALTIKDKEIQNLNQSSELKDQQIENEELVHLVLILAVTCAILLIGLLLYVWIRQVQYTSRLKKQRESLVQKHEEIQQQNKKIALQRDEVTNRNRVISHQNQHLMAMNKLHKHVISVISHDIRRPVATIRQWLTDLHEHAKQQVQEAPARLGEMEEASSRLLILIDNLLKWSKTQVSGEEPELREVALLDVIEQVSNRYQDLAESKNIRLRFDWEAQHVPVLADEELLDIIMRNLINNALKFTEPGGEVSIAVCFATETIVMVQVMDNGRGMTQPQIDYILENPGEIVEIGTAGEQGSGLGLVLVNEFLNKIKGRLEIESVLGKGSTFTVYLTAYQPEPANVQGNSASS